MKPIKDKFTVKPWELPTGHKAHYTGTGVHFDKRLKRLKTRRNQSTNAIREFE